MNLEETARQEHSAQVEAVGKGKGREKVDCSPSARSECKTSIEVVAVDQTGGEPDNVSYGEVESGHGKKQNACHCDGCVCYAYDAELQYL